MVFAVYTNDSSVLYTIMAVVSIEFERMDVELL